MPKASNTVSKTHELLARYQSKRDFTQTAEPSGRLAVAPSERLRPGLPWREKYPQNTRLSTILRGLERTPRPSILPIFLDVFELVRTSAND